MEVIVETDGGARGNPGPAAIAAVVSFGNKKKILTEHIGHATNNQAEYRAVILALRWVKGQYPMPIRLELRIDSELVGRQLTGLYRIRDQKLRPLFDEAKTLLGGFEESTVTVVKRAENTEADRLVNRVLDAQ